MKRSLRILVGLAVFASGITNLTPVFGWQNDQKSPDQRPWYQRSLVGLEVGPTGAQFGNSDPQDTGYCRSFDGREIVEATRKTGAQYLVIWARDGDYAYYDSAFLPKPIGLGQRDPLRETMQAAAEHNLPVIAYCVVQQAGALLKAHPEWEMKGVDGQPLGRYCLNSGYRQSLKRMLDEQLDYGVDGFHIDMLDQGFGPPFGCWCETCREKFQEKYGHPMPQSLSWDQEWQSMLEFRYQTSADLEIELSRHIKSRNTQATVDFNYHGNPPFSWEVGQRPVQHAIQGDFVTGETGTWGFSALGVGLNAEFYRAANPGVPFQVAMQRGVRMYHDQTTRPLADLRWELFTLLAHGALVTIVDKTAFDGSLDPVAYERFRLAFDEVHTKQDHFGQNPIRHVGIYFSSKTRDWYGRESPEKYFQSFLGAHRVCALEHLSYEILLDENTTPQRLKDLPVLLVPNAAILSPSEVDLLTGYVHDGGQLIVTGHSGQFDATGNPTSQDKWEELIGARVINRLPQQDNWTQFPASEDSSSPWRPMTGQIRADWPFLTEGPATIYQPTTARAWGQLRRPDRTARQQQGKMGFDWPMSPDQSVGPALLQNDFGKGRVLIYAGSPDYATASEHPIIEARTWLANGIRMLAPPPAVQVSAPAHVQTVVTDDPVHRKLRVHLLAYLSTPQTTPPRNRPYVIPGLIEDSPLYRVRLRINRPANAVYATDPSTAITRDDDQIQATIENIHEVIVVDY